LGAREATKRKVLCATIPKADHRILEAPPAVFSSVGCTHAIQKRGRDMSRTLQSQRRSLGHRYLGTARQHVKVAVNCGSCFAPLESRGTATESLPGTRLLALSRRGTYSSATASGLLSHIGQHLGGPPSATTRRRRQLLQEHPKAHGAAQGKGSGRQHAEVRPAHQIVNARETC
jgi:hypothetical protein